MKMVASSYLKGKKLLIVDDEPDILETLKDILDMCDIDSAPDFEIALKFLRHNSYDAAVLDIMGVRGYDLLDMTNKLGIPAIMLTAHALSPRNLVESIKGGAYAYLPKDKMIDLPEFLTDLIVFSKKGINKDGTWFAKLKTFFDEKFEKGWQEQDKQFWEDFNREYVVSKEELKQML
jgi:CheY-like chemotaxis protein